jgi:hypothetical protein
MCLNESEYRKYLSDNFPNQNNLKQGDSLSLLLLGFGLEYTIRKIQENQVGRKLNGTHQLLVYADDLYLLGDKKAPNRKTQSLIDDTKEVGLEVNAEKSKYISPSSPECMSNS